MWRQFMLRDVVLRHVLRDVVLYHVLRQIVLIVSGCVASVLRKVVLWQIV